MPRLPLFPLNTVVFPGGRLPLRIFEPRYKQLLKDCLESDRTMGIVLIKSGLEVGGPAEPYSIGTQCRIDELGAPAAGAIPLTLVGERRFRISSLDRSLPYLVGEVAMLRDEDDPEAGLAAEALRPVAQKYVRLLFASQGEYRGQIDLPDDPATLSDLAGTLLYDQTPELRQTVLEAEPLSAWLRLMTRVLERSARTIEKKIMRSGPGRGPTTFGLN